MFKVGDKVVVIGNKEVLSVIKADGERCLVEWPDGQRLLFNSSSICKAPKREVDILIRVEVSDDAKYVAVDKNGSVYEYFGDCEECLVVFYSDKRTKRLCIKNWKQTKTKVD